MTSFNIRKAFALSEFPDYMYEGDYFDRAKDSNASHR